MSFLQEAIIGGPILLIAAIFIGALLVLGLIILFKTFNGADHNKKTTKKIDYGGYIFAFILLGAALVLMNWVCNIKFD